MSEIRLAMHLGWSTLRSRPTLTLLAIGLMSLAGALLGGLSGSVYVLRGLQTEFLSALTIELELVDSSDSLRVRVLQSAEDWPDAEIVQYVPPEMTLKEFEAETGENLQDAFGSNPFPPIVRIRFGDVSIQRLDSLTADAASWQGVTKVVYPRQLWNHLNQINNSIRGRAGLVALIFALIAVALLGLCLRAQVRNRSEAWELVALLGLSEKTLAFSLLFQELVVGVAGGFLACVILSGFSLVISWVLLHDVSFPFWFYLCVLLGCAGLAVLAGTLSPRKFTR